MNQTVATSESPRPHTVDMLASMGKSMMSAAPGAPLLGKAYDLTAAYRQLPLHPSTYWNSFIAVWDHTKQAPAVFQLRALPFGASKSVYSFLRTSHSLWWLACMALSIVWTLYYDDFICLSSSMLASHTDNCVRAFFFLLGWQFSSSGDKHMDFSEVFTALGVTVQLSSCLDGRLTISNTTRRIKELVEAIQSILSSGSLSKAQALKLRGRMQFAEGQLFGRVGRLCLRAVSDHAYLAATATTSASLNRALARFAKMLEFAMPRTVKIGLESSWHVFTDASYDPSSCTWPCGVGDSLERTYSAHKIPEGRPFARPLFWGAKITRKPASCQGACAVPKIPTQRSCSWHLAFLHQHQLHQPQSRQDFLRKYPLEVPVLHAIVQALGSGSQTSSGVSVAEAGSLKPFFCVTFSTLL